MKSVFRILIIFSITILCGSAQAETECMPALLKIIAASPVPLTGNQLVKSDEVSNLQEHIFDLRARGQFAEAQIAEDKISSILKGDYFYSKELGSGAAGGRYYFFDLGIVGVGKKAGRHWSTNVEAEVGAYKIDRLYNLNLVPLTVSRDDAKGHMSMQLFYKNANEIRFHAIPNVSESDRQKMRVFDYLIQNFDRRESNYLATPEGRIVAIDHGVTLHNLRSNPYSPHAPKLNELDFNFFKTEAGVQFLHHLRAVSDSEITEALRPFSNEKAIQEFIERKNTLLAAIPTQS